jgi:hypothetical protein
MDGDRIAGMITANDLTECNTAPLRSIWCIIYKQPRWFESDQNWHQAFGSKHLARMPVLQHRAIDRNIDALTDPPQPNP